MRTQRGYLYQSHGSWFVRHWEGQKQQAHRLASVKDYPKKSEVKPLADEYMATVNATRTTEAAGTFSEFFGNSFLPVCKLRLSSHGIRNYKMCGNRLNPQIGGMRLRDIKTFHIQQALDAIHKDAGSGSATACIG